MEQIRIKYVFLGDEGIGKTSLIVRYTKGIFLQYSESTIGCSFNAKPLKLDNKELRLDIWDTAGQERYRSMMPMYYRNADIIFLCVDLSKISIMKTFNSWFKELNRHNDNKDKRVVYLVGTKADIKNDIVMNDIDIILNRYPNIRFIETSSKDDYNIKELFKNSAELFLEKLNARQNQYGGITALSIKENNTPNSWLGNMCNLL